MENQREGTGEPAAQEIYDFLHKQKGKSELLGFGKGIVRFQQGRELRVILSAPEDGEDLYAQRGFSKEEIDSGIIVIIDDHPEGRLYKNLVLSGKRVKAVVQQSDRLFVETEISDEELEAIYTIARLSAIPGRIVNGYGDLSSFLKLINNPDLTGISSAMDASGASIVYNGGFHNYVEAINRMREGSWDTGASDRRAVSMSSKDNSSYYENIISKIDKIRKSRQVD